MTDLISSCISNLKHLPGVYLMYNQDNKIIYIGKAKDLYKRVSQYFLREQYGKVARMVSEAHHFDTIITENEKEALVLEMNLIKHHHPKYNILLKDDSHYPYIALKKGEDPYLTIKRNTENPNYYYFGPFPSGANVHQILDLLNKIFPLRKCNRIPSSPCLYYHLGQCLAPCINKIDDSTYKEIIEEIRRFLSGDTSKERREYENKMKEASDSMNYELAQEYKDIIDSIDHITAKQNVEMKDKVNRDIFAFSSRDNLLSLVIFSYVNGVLLAKKSFVVETFGNQEEEVADLILQYYQSHPLPRDIVINNDSVREELESYLSCNITNKSKGPIYDLVVLAKENANNALDQYFLSARIDEGKEELLNKLADLLHISFPTRIEMFDNSHIAGSDPVGVMVVFINGEKCPSMYRKYKLNEDDARDDLKDMEEIMTRRYKRMISEDTETPDLIFVDGGITQLEVGAKVLSTLDLDIPIFGLYKDDKHRTKGIVTLDNQVINVEDESLFFLLTRMQDEVHRFAIKYHHETRSRHMTKSYLDGISGIGEVRKEKILALYPSLELFNNATLSELEEILPKDVATNLYNLFHTS